MTGIAWRGNNDHHAGPQKATRRYRPRSSPQAPNQTRVGHSGVFRFYQFQPTTANEAAYR